MEVLLKDKHLYQILLLLILLLDDDEDDITILQDCLNHRRLRRDFWPEATTMQSKLYGTIGDLRRTASFITTTGLPV